MFRTTAAQSRSTRTLLSQIQRWASDATAAEDKVVIYERSPLKLTLVGITVFLSSIGGLAAGGFISLRALHDPTVPENKRSILLMLGVSTATLFPGLLIPFWRLFGRGYGTRLILNRRTNVLDVQTVGFVPGTKVIESYNIERIHVLGPRFKEKSVLTTPTLIFRKNNGDPKYADNLKSYMFEKKRNWFKNEVLFQDLAAGKYTPPQ